MKLQDFVNTVMTLGIRYGVVSRIRKGTVVAYFKVLPLHSPIESKVYSPTIPWLPWPILKYCPFF
jgi:hypothetical protein